MPKRTIFLFSTVFSGRGLKFQPIRSEKAPFLASDWSKFVTLPQKYRTLYTLQPLTGNFLKVINWHTIEVKWVLLDDGLTGIDTFTIYLNSQIDGGEGSSYRIPNR